MHGFARKAVFFAMCVQIVLATWLMSGTWPEFLLPMFAVSIGAYALCVIGKLFDRGGIFQAVLAWAAIFFVVVCLIQYANPFAEHVVEEKFSYIAFSDYADWLPTSVRAEFYEGNSLSSLCVLLTSFLTALALTAISDDRKYTFSLLAFFSLNTLLMGMFALWQQSQGVPMPYNKFHTNSGFYGTFFLSNAAGAYLNMGVAAALACFANCIRRKGFIAKFASILFFMASVAISWASYRSESKGAMIMCFGIWAAVCAYFIWVVSAKIFGSKISALAACVLGVAACAVGILHASEHMSISDLPYDRQLGDSARSRIEIYKATIPIIMERPIWGGGGECSRYLLPIVRKSDGSGVAEIPDRAHSDLLEYMVDFGIVGVAVLLACGVAWIAQIIRNRRCLTAANVICAIGALSCLAHGMFDMELHVPSTMIAFAFMCVFSFSDFGTGSHDEI